MKFVPLFGVATGAKAGSEKPGGGASNSALKHTIFLRPYFIILCSFRTQLAGNS